MFYFIFSLYLELDTKRTGHQNLREATSCQRIRIWKGPAKSTSFGENGKSFGNKASWKR